MKSLEYHAEANRRSYQKHKTKRLAEQKVYRVSQAGRATQSRKDKTQQQLNPLHWGARSAVWRAKRSGKLEPTRYCEIQGCLVRAYDGLQAHHHKGYDKKHWLDVVWLCPKHHLEAHNGNLEVIGNIYENKELLK